MTQKQSALEFLIANREEVIKALQETDSIPKAWNQLTETLPEIAGIMKEGTFQSYAGAIRLVDIELKKLQQLQKENESLRSKLEKAGHSEHPPEIDQLKKQIEIARYEKASLEKELHRTSKELSEARSKKEKIQQQLDTAEKKEGYQIPFMFPSFWDIFQNFWKATVLMNPLMMAIHDPTSDKKKK